MEKREIEKKTKKSWKILFVILILLNLIVAALLAAVSSEKNRLEAQFFDSTVSRENVQEEIIIHLPKTVYAANGVTMELYNSQITNLGSDITRYNVRWNCEIGENLERRFSVSANEENLGSYELSLEIYNNQLELVAEETCTLVLVEVDLAKKEESIKVLQFSEVPENCLEQVMCSVDTEYNGTFEALKPEGVTQMQDVICSVLSGI